MTCRDIDQLLSSQDRLAPSTLPPAARNHAHHCPRCGPLIGVLSRPDRNPDAPDALLAGIECTLLADLQPVTPLRPAGSLTAGFLALFAVVVVIGVWRLKALAAAAMNALQDTAIAVVLPLGALLLAGSLSRQMAPGSRRHYPAARLVFLVALAIMTAFSAVFPFGEAGDFVRTGLKCLTTGVVFAAVTAALFWILLRRGVFVSPLFSGATAGLLAGLAGTSVLQIHCPLLEARHILAWHVGAAALSACAGLAAAGLATLWSAKLRLGPKDAMNHYHKAVLPRKKG